MRNAFTKRLSELAEKDNNIVVITNDATTPSFLEFQKKYPDRFINAGLAEQNMTGMAAGIALTGKTVFTYSIIPFVLMRCYEQVRDDVCYQRTNVKIIGIGGGIVYSTLAGTHTALEDISLTRGLPNMTVIVPVDPLEAEKAAETIVLHKGPAYIRLARTGEPNLYQRDYKFKIGKAVTMKRGRDATIIGYGPILAKALQAARELEKEGVSVEVVNMHTLKPIDEKAILRAVRKTGGVVTIEEHGAIGGLKSVVSELLVKKRLQLPFESICLKHEFLTNYGKQTDILDTLGFSVNGIKKVVEKTIRQKKKNSSR